MGEIVVFHHLRELDAALEESRRSAGTLERPDLEWAERQRDALLQGRKMGDPLFVCADCGRACKVHRLCKYCWSRAMRLGDESVLTHGRPK